MGKTEKLLRQMAQPDIRTNGGIASANGEQLVLPNHSGNHIANIVQCTGFIMPTGAGVGKVLKCDANGNATWETL